jgi:hypothetical protein
MSKKMKLNLEELKVQSFVTSYNDNYLNNFKAGQGQSGVNTCTCPTNDTVTFETYGKTCYTCLE